MDLLALSSHWEKLNRADAAIEMSVVRLRVVQALQSHTSHLRWLACTEMGPGTFTAEPSKTSPHAKLLGGATSGFVKSAMREWKVWNRCVDLSGAIPANWLKQELLDSSSYSEVLYQNNQRFVPVFSNQTADQTVKGLSPEVTLPNRARELPVLVITGGGSGITATITESLARRMKFRAVILGRTILSDDSAALPLHNKAETRKILKARLGPKASSKEIQEEIKRAEKQAGVAEQLTRYRDLGVECLYLPTDMNDGQAVKDAMTQAIETFGSVDAVIHGAGVDLSRELASKTPEEVRFVMSVKLKGLSHLYDALAEQDVKAWLSFGSVSSRFGNIGQVDYAAANEAMARWLVGDEFFQRALIVDYTAWDEVGMAASLAKFMTERGVDILSPKPTSRHTAILWHQGAQGEWVYSGRLPEEKTPLGQVSLRIPRTEIYFERQLNTDQLLFLQDHKMGDTEIQPGVVSLAWMQLAAQEVGEGTLYPQIRDVRFAKALKLFPGKQVKMQTHAHRDGNQVLASIHSQRQRKGKQESHDHAFATFVPFAEHPKPQNPKNSERKTMTKDSALSSIYNIFFHGPTWQVLGEAWHSETQTITSLQQKNEQLGQGLPEDLRHNAVGRELVLQSAGLWGLRKKNLYLLPYGIEALTVHQNTSPHEPRQAHVQFVEQIDDQLIFHAQLYGKEHRLLQSFHRLSMRIFPIPTS